MLLERPMIDRSDLLWTLDPRGERAVPRYRRLLREAVLTPGVVTQTRRGGRLTGSARIFCSLNRELVAAKRAERLDLLADLRAETMRIESELVREWAEAIGEHLARSRDVDEALPLGDGRPRISRPGDNWLRAALRWQDEQECSAVTAVALAAAQEVQRVRATLERRDFRPVVVTLGRVWRIGDERAEIRAVEPAVQEAFSFFTDEVFSAGLRLGDPVAVRHEAVGPGGVITTIEPALDTEGRAEHLGDPAPPAHLDGLLDESRLSVRSSEVPPLRRVA